MQENGGGYQLPAFKKILITAGPIPGKLDSVKFITNRFKGGLMFKLAEELSKEYDVTIMKWKHTIYNKPLLTTKQLVSDLYDKTPPEEREKNFKSINCGHLIYDRKLKFDQLMEYSQLILIDYYQAREDKIRNFVYRNPTVIDVEDVYDYCDKVTEKEYDCFIMGAAVANLVPKNPYEGKFPSHNYKVGDVIPIDFVIAPRAIDEIKKKYPRSLLVGYKLFDGTEEELIKAGWHTLTDSKANVIFCNHPVDAKSLKLALLPDGTIIPMSFEEHVSFIDRMINLKWYRTMLTSSETIADVSIIQKEKLEFANELLEKVIIKSKARSKNYSTYDFGTIAIKHTIGTNTNGFITTTRGKKLSKTGSKFTYVHSVDFDEGIVFAIEKATLNAPMLAKLFELYPECDVIIHGHFPISEAKEFFQNGNTGYVKLPYMFPGTTDETPLGNNLTGIDRQRIKMMEISGHGCYICLQSEIKTKYQLK